MSNDSSSLRNERESCTENSTCSRPRRKRQKKQRFLVLSDSLLKASTECEEARQEYEEAVAELATEANVSLLIKPTPKRTITLDRLLLMLEKANDVVLWFQLGTERLFMIMAFVMGRAMTLSCYVHVVAPDSLIEMHPGFFEFLTVRSKRFMTYNTMDEVLISVAPPLPSLIVSSLPLEGSNVVVVAALATATANQTTSPTHLVEDLGAAHEQTSCPQNEQSQQ